MKNILVLSFMLISALCIGQSDTTVWNKGDKFIGVNLQMSHLPSRIVGFVPQVGLAISNEGRIIANIQRSTFDGDDDEIINRLQIGYDHEMNRLLYGGIGLDLGFRSFGFYFDVGALSSLGDKGWYWALKMQIYRYTTDRHETFANIASVLTLGYRFK